MIKPKIDSNRISYKLNYNFKKKKNQQLNLEKKKYFIILTGLSSKLSRVVPTKIETAPQISSVTSSEIELMSNFPDVNLIKFILRFVFLSPSLSFN